MKPIRLKTRWSAASPAGGELASGDHLLLRGRHIWQEQGNPWLGLWVPARLKDVKATQEVLGLAAHSVNLEKRHSF